ncbi:acid phosphatase/Vanadium-dependent haloperoxidase [Linnemannia elongata AG-77]|uniref:Acid phosphatase/Vanadium-dependent haloperoxidase n=1 Tax=Linnemannia elongata AG-77 TaxID=1314771 RepID=A0A197JDN6_9FUNG|nr:acid phosphatase/Vanadium-dependent haloperoxidase [Linnemannia elongata AG-77]
MFSALRMKTRTRELFKSYCKDWTLVVIVLVAFSIVDQLEPFHRQFSVRDITIQHPFAKQETVPVWLLLTLSFLLPMATVAAIAVFQRRSYTDLHNGFLGLFLAQSLVLIVTDSIKIAVGRPRPDFLDRCLSLYDNANGGNPLDQLNDPVNLLSNSSICTRTDLLRDGFKSFPSGHSSFSFGGLGFLSMYLAGKLHLFDERGHIYKSLVVLAPMILAALIATSRVSDYRHHWQDVTAGSFIGFFFAVFAYRQYYPSLASNKSDRPFSPRIREDFLPGGSFLGISSSNDRDNNGQRYRDDAGNDDDTHVVVDGPSTQSPGDESGIGFGQFFRRDRTDETLTGNGHGGPNKNVVGNESRLIPI